MIKYFIYCRKSSEDEERQILSIEAQLTELREFAKQNNLFVVKEYYESKTAKEPGREVFNFMMSEIEKGNAHRQFNKISLCLSPTAKEKNRLIALWAIQILFVNRRLAAERLEIDFKKPFDLLAKLPAEARGEAPSEATNSIWWRRRELNPRPKALLSGFYMFVLPT